MPLLPRLRSLWNTLVHTDRLDSELDAELRAAVETLVQRHVAAGMTPEAARRSAVHAVGGRGGIEHVRSEVRENRIGAGLDALLLDLRYAWRGLSKSRGVTAIIVLTLALGIGANTAIFSVVRAMLLEPLPYRDAGRLVFIWLDRNQIGYPRGPMSGPDLRDLRDRTRSFADVGGIWSPGSITLSGESEPEQIRGAMVTTNFFQVLGAEAALGRTFRAEDSANGAEPSILLGWDLFQRRYGGDPAVVGRKITVNDDPVTVIGVMPPAFRLLLPTDASVPDHLQAWVPFWPDLEGGPRRNLFLRVVARLRHGVTIETARDDVAAMARRLSAEIGAARAFTVLPLHDDNVREIRGPLVALFVGVGILLAIACVNVASLLIARAASRARETALRLALGATRGRLLRQALVEGLLLTAVGAGAGICAGYGALRALLALTPESLSRLDASRVDLTVLAFTVGVSFVWGVLFSLAPLFELIKVEPAAWFESFWRETGPRSGVFALLASGAGRSTSAPVRYRLRTALIVVQIAMSMVLLVGAGLLVRGFIEVLRVDPGFRSGRHLTFRIAIPGRYGTHDAFNAFGDELRRRLSALPGVDGAGAISHIPYDDLPNWALPYHHELPIPPDAPMATSRAISPGLFEMLGVRLIEGRLFTEQDRNPKNPVAIIDETLARQVWPSRSAIGQRLPVRFGSEQVMVVGVVRHLRLRSLVDDPSPQIFLPWAMAQRNPIAFIVSTIGDPAALAPQIRDVVSSIDSRVPPYDVRPLRAYVENARATRRFTMLLAAAFAATALALTCVGVYGVLAYAVTRRRHEFGVRRALGADARQVLAEVLREGLAFAAIGCLAGLAAAAVAASLLRTQLYAVHPRDPLAFGVALILILGGSLIACWIPAHRATTISPMDALRSE